MGLAKQRFRHHLRRAGADVGGVSMSVSTTNVTSEPEIALDQLLHMFRRMTAIRLFEERVNDLYTRALMPGLAHLYIGEEAVAVGVCEALEPTDYITSTHRGHGHCLAKGATPDLMFAELLGKEAGYCKGKGGSMHIADPVTGNLGANAIVAGSAGIATGAAFSAKHLGSRRQRLLLRRRRVGAGRSLRSDEHGAALEAAGHLRLREQHVQRVHALLGNHRRRDSGARPAASESRPSQRRRAGRAGRLRRGSQGCRARAPGRGARRFCCAIRIATTATMWAISAASTTGRKQEEQRWKTERDPITLLSRLAARTIASTGRRLTRSKRN